MLQINDPQKWDDYVDFMLHQTNHETYRFAKLKSWAATSEAVTFKVSKDEG